jgi:aquaporin Z
MKRALVELLGTFFFVLTIAMTGSPIAIAAMLMAWVYIGGYISGAHYNPAVSLAVALRGHLTWKEFPRYVLAQIVGGIAAFACTSYLQGQVTLPAPGAGVGFGQAFIVEVGLAFVLALVVLVVATSDKFKNSQVFGFAIGFTIPALAVLGSPISGGLFNPAIAIGAALFGAAQGNAIVWPDLFMYVGGALIGGFLAAWAFRHLVLEK